MANRAPDPTAPPLTAEPAAAPAVERAIELDATVEEVWELLTDPAAGAWLGDVVELDLRPGGTGRVVDGDGRRDLLVVDVDVAERLTWHWWHEDGPLSTVEITLAPTSTGTLVRVVETLDPSTLPADGPRMQLRAGGRTMTCAGAEAAGGAWAARLGRLGRLGQLRAPVGPTLAAAGV